jgi:PPOX class probable F420-dependent enzyme
MAKLSDAGVSELLAKPICAVISTNAEDGSINSSVVWLSADDEGVAVNSALGRVWPTNLQRDPHVTLLVANPENPMEYVEIRGQAAATTDGAEAHIDELAKKYLGKDEYPWRNPADTRIRFDITPDRVRHVSM